MVASNVQVNKKLLPIKGHYFFFNAGTAPLVPYLSTYARQLGFSSATVGLIYTVLPIFGLVAKPLFGVIADRFKIQKSIFIIFQIVTIVSFGAIYFVPSNGGALTVDLDCGNGVTVLRSCYLSTELVDTCKITSLGDKNTSSYCHMNCDMSSPKMWQTVCEHWHIPQYCYSHTDEVKYSAHINQSQIKQQCAYLSSNNVTFDGNTYTPGCRIGQGYVDINEPCHLNCTDQKLSSLLSTEQVNMTCLDQSLSFRVCPNDSAPFEKMANSTWQGDDCQVQCELEKESPWRLMEICEGWQADAAATCRPKTEAGAHFPANLSFIGSVPLSTTLVEHNCVFIQLNHITLPDGTIRYPICHSKTQYQMESQLLQTSCEITCDNPMLNEIFTAAAESEGEEISQFTKQFWLFFTLMIVSWIGQAVVVTFADAICFNLLGTKVSLYGKQRLWGSVGWGIFSLATGALIDLFSDGAVKDYTVAFVLMLVFMTGDVIVSALLKIESTRISFNILADVGVLLSTLPTFVFLLWTIAVGLCTGLLWQFLFWLLEDISQLSCEGMDYTKTLQGLVSAIQTFCGEIPFLFVSGYILRKVGHANTMSLVLFAFGVRFILYSVLQDPWWVLPIETLQGVTFGMFYPTMTSYASVVAPSGTETTVQGLVGAVFEGVGTSLGSFIGGRLYGEYGGWLTFRWFGYGALVACALHALAQRFLLPPDQGYSTVIRYEQPSDTVYMLEDPNEGKL